MGLAQSHRLSAQIGVGVITVASQPARNLGTIAPEHRGRERNRARGVDNRRRPSRPRATEGCRELLRLLGHRASALRMRRRYCYVKDVVTGRAPSVGCAGDSAIGAACARRKNCDMSPRRCANPADLLHAVPWHGPRVAVGSGPPVPTLDDFRNWLVQQSNMAYANTSSLALRVGDAFAEQTL